MTTRFIAVLLFVLLVFPSVAAHAQRWYESGVVVDGDTTYLVGIKTRVRLVAVRAPENNNKCHEVGGREATRMLADLLTGRLVRVEYERARRKDKYGRPLYYLFRDDGLFINDYLIRQGYARYAPDVKSRYAARLAEAQGEAIKERRGIWKE